MVTTRLLRMGGLILVFAFVLIGIWTSCSQAPEPSTELAPVPTVTASSETALRIGILAIRSAEAASAQYGPIVTYLSDVLQRPFILVPLNQESQFQQAADGTIDFTLNNPLAAVQLRRIYRMRFLATVNRPLTGTKFSGLIVAKAGGTIKTVADLKGKHVTCVAFQTAAAGCNFQVFHLLQAGVTPDDFAAFTETPSQDNIVLGVLNGTFDAGFIRTGQLEKMVNEGLLLNLDEILIVDQAIDDFYFPHTTRLYPEWPFAALAHIDDELAQRVQTALLEMPADLLATTDSQISGFVEPEDYAPLDELIEALQLRSYDAER